MKKNFSEGVSAKNSSKNNNIDNKSDRNTEQEMVKNNMKKEISPSDFIGQCVVNDPDKKTDWGVITKSEDGRSAIKNKKLDVWFECKPTIDGIKILSVFEDFVKPTIRKVQTPVRKNNGWLNMKKNDDTRTRYKISKSPAIGALNEIENEMLIKHDREKNLNLTLKRLCILNKEKKIDFNAIFSSKMNGFEKLVHDLGGIDEIILFKKLYDSSNKYVHNACEFISIPDWAYDGLEKISDYIYSLSDSEILNMKDSESVGETSSEIKEEDMKERKRRIEPLNVVFEKDEHLPGYDDYFGKKSKKNEELKNSSDFSQKFNFNKVSDEDSCDNYCSTITEETKEFHCDDCYGEPDVPSPKERRVKKADNADDEQEYFIDLGSTSEYQKYMGFADLGLPEGPVKIDELKKVVDLDDVKNLDFAVKKLRNEVHKDDEETKEPHIKVFLDEVFDIEPEYIKNIFIDRYNKKIRLEVKESGTRFRMRSAFWTKKDVDSDGRFQGFFDTRKLKNFEVRVNHYTEKNDLIYNDVFEADLLTINERHTEDGEHRYEIEFKINRESFIPANFDEFTLSYED